MTAKRAILPGKERMDAMISAPDSNEYVNALSHLLGAILSISATAVLITLGAQDQKWRV